MDAVSEARGRRWADIVASLASVVLFGFSVWGGVLAGDSDSLSEVRNIGLARGSNMPLSGFFVGPMPTDREERR